MNEFVLKGIDGANPLGFLAAVGVLKTVDQVNKREHDPPLMGWRIEFGAWRPVLHFDSAMDEDSLVSILYDALQEGKNNPAFQFASDLSLAAEVFRKEALSAQNKATYENRSHADFVSAFANEIVCDEKTGRIADTAFRTMSGAGHQHFLGTMLKLALDTNQAHIWKALFATWLYDDPVEKHTMRWDPMDDIRYALQWQNPSGDPMRRSGGSMWGANRLAIEALTLFPTSPSGLRLETTGFAQRKGNGILWTWPIWVPLISVETLRSLLSMAELQNPVPDRGCLQRIGIVEIFRCQRLTQGKFRNFSSALPA